MKSLRSRILLALLASTVLALLVVAVIQRSSIQRAFGEYVQRQELEQLRWLVPELEAWYQRNGGWDDLRDNPRRWLELLARSRNDALRPPEQEISRGRESRRPRPPPPAWWELRRRVLERGDLRQLWSRLYLLDEQGALVVGTDPAGAASQGRELEIAGQTVGFIGFVTSAEPTAPEAQRFLRFQRNTLVVSSVIALAMAALLGVWLARSLTRPVVALRDTVQSIADGDFEARAEISGRDEIGQLQQRVNRMAEALQANRSSRQRWTADVAHELRTPVTVLSAELEAMADGIRPLDPAALQSLREEVAQLGRLVDDLQSLALADAGALDLRFERVQLGELVRQQCDSFRSVAAEAGLEFDVRVDGDPSISADAQRIRQLLHNLLLNSCRHTHRGGRVQVTLEASAMGGELRVEDSPPGVAPEQLSQLFDRFYRADRSRQRATGGSGLGLAICREIVLAHGGQIRAEASSLGGLRIVVGLPNHA